ncbi:threonine ammonia-lyase [Enterococcus sp. AZ196]|uniref:threonine ammonia-lyase n=1 Tax=Enterococcus sp. AZ196 TaxID=2774659 RepID=UPI003D2D5687
MRTSTGSVSVNEIIKAKTVIERYVSETPLTHYPGLSTMIGCRVFIKHENHLLGGSFKIRGGINKMFHLKKTDTLGVITFSTGNHGISVGMAANLFDIPATVVVPNNNNPGKNQLIKETGARLIESGNNFDEAAITGKKIQENEQLEFIHAANDSHLINGVGTEFLEILHQLKEVDAIILPIGGGSELAAAVTVFNELSPKTKIYAVQAKASSAAYQSWREGKIVKSSNETFAGGFATGEAYELPFSIYSNKLSGFITLTEEELLQGIALSFKYTHNLAEGAGAATIMAAFKLKEELKGKNVVLQMSGANEMLSVLKESLKFSEL